MFIMDYIMAYLFRGLVRGLGKLRSRGWPTTIAQLESADPEGGPFPYVRLTAHYSVDGVKYAASTKLGFYFRDSAAAAAGRFRHAQSLTVRYNLLRHGKSFIVLD